jgi:hypothetical protein
MGTGGGFPVFTPFLTVGLKMLFSFYEPPGPSIELLRQVVQHPRRSQRASTRSG